MWLNDGLKGGEMGEKIGRNEVGTRKVQKCRIWPMRAGCAYTRLLK